MGGFETLIPEARGFLGELAANNTRDWFGDHKAAYEAAVKRPGEVLLAEIEHFLATTLDQPTRPKLYLVHRDVRFSKDKTPYNTHMHLQWSQTRGAPICFLFGVEAGYSKVGVGAFVFDKEALIRWREAIDGSDKIARILDEMTTAGWHMEEPELKRVPAPYGKEHPRGALLRRKGCVVWRDLTASEETAPFEALKTHFSAATKLRKELDRALS